MGRLHVPGVAIGVLSDGKEYTAGFGVTNVTYPAPVMARTLFQIGSITKTVTAVTVLRLVEAGVLELNTPARRYLPDLTLADESVTARVTLRHLLTHTPGWEGDFALLLDTGRGDDALAKFIAMLSQAPQLTPLGEVWSYNNAGFCLAGRVIEAVTGKTYEQAAKELTLAPLGMTHACFFPEEAMLSPFTVGHHVLEGHAEIARPWPIPRNANPAGGVITTVGDLLGYARFTMGDGTTADGERFLSSATLNLMRTPQVTVGGRGSVGLAWFMEEIGGVRLVGHDGGTIGQIARLHLVPERQFALAILTNASTGGDLLEEVTWWALEHYLNLKKPEKVYQERTPEQLGSYAGHYTSTSALADLTVRDGTLMLGVRDSESMRERLENPTPPRPPSSVAFYGADEIVATDGPLKGVTADFLRHPDGSIAWLRLGGRLYRRAPETPSA
jgi:CubicO group peptidase (beta-lactamase class C family)